MDGFQHIDLNNSVHIADFDFNQFLLDIGLNESYSYHLDGYRSITGWKNPGICDLKVEIFEDDIDEYIMTIESNDLDMHFGTDNSGVYNTLRCEEISEMIVIKLSQFFNLDSSDMVFEHIESFFDGVPGEDDLDDINFDTDEVDATMEDNDMDEYKYDKYLFLFFDSYRKYGARNDVLGDADHIKTIVLEKFALYDIKEGHASVVATNSSDDAVVADMYRVSYKTIEAIQSQLPSGMKKIKIPSTDVWYFAHMDGEYIQSSFERVNSVCDMNPEEKYAECDYSDWIDYSQIEGTVALGEYDIIDTFKSDTATAATQNTPPKVPLVESESDDVYSREQYDKIRKEYQAYCAVKKESGEAVYETGTAEDDNMFMEWFISDAAREIRVELEEVPA